MDDGAKALIFMMGGAGVVATLVWAFHKIFGPPPREPGGSTTEHVTGAADGSHGLSGSDTSGTHH